MLDSLGAYNMIPLVNTEENMNKSCFVTRRGSWRYKYLMFGEKNAASTYSRLMSLVLSGIEIQIALAYIDDIIIWRATFDETL